MTSIIATTLKILMFGALIGLFGVIAYVFLFTNQNKQKKS